MLFKFNGMARFSHLLTLPILFWKRICMKSFIDPSHYSHHHLLKSSLNFDNTITMDVFSNGYSKSVVCVFCTGQDWQFSRFQIQPPSLFSSGFTFTICLRIYSFIHSFRLSRGWLHTSPSFIHTLYKCWDVWSSILTFL